MRLSPLHRSEVETGDGRLVVRADPLRLAQVLGNLLDNAAKFSQAGGTIRLRVTAEGAGVAVEVRSEGIGLPPEATQAVLVPGARGTNAETAHLPGLGLGLAIGREIVEAHGGRIGIRSEGEGRGATRRSGCPPPVPRRRRRRPRRAPPQGRAPGAVTCSPRSESPRSFRSARPQARRPPFSRSTMGSSLGSARACPRPFRLTPSPRGASSPWLKWGVAGGADRRLGSLDGGRGSGGSPSLRPTGARRVRHDRRVEEGGMDAEADRRQAGEGTVTEFPTAFVETTPADRAGWEEALAAESTEGGDVASPRQGADLPTVVPEYEEEHPPGPPSDPDDLSIADLRPEVEGETTAERARREGTAG